MFSSALLAAVVLLPRVFATPFITEPVSATSWAAGTQQTITWEDNGDTPGLAAFGNAEVGVYVGNALQQTELQQIVASVNVSSTAAITFTPDATMGGNGDFYFVRMTSLTAMNGQYPYQAFSAKFSLTGMTGNFNGTVSSEIAGASSAPIGGSASTSAASAASVTPTSSHPSLASSSSHAPSSSASAAGANKNGALSLSTGPVTGVAFAAVAVLGAMLL